LDGNCTNCGYTIEHKNSEILQPNPPKWNKLLCGGCHQVKKKKMAVVGRGHKSWGTYLPRLEKRGCSNSIKNNPTFGVIEEDKSSMPQNPNTVLQRNSLEEKVMQ
jgi:hypothetical protein